MNAANRPVLEVRDLVREFVLRDGRRRRTLRAVDRVDLDLLPGTTVALVGESGSGKSTVARILARLLEPTSGTIRLDGTEVGGRRGLRRYREHVQIVFQDPFASLNPFHTIDHHLRRPVRLHHPRDDRRAVDERVEQLLERVNLYPPKLVAAKRPHELSGGQRQRVAIARALAPRPRVLLADEPVSMLDVSIRLEILNLLDRLRAEDDLAVLYITHDLATARHFASRVVVLFHGEVVESGDSDDVILRPKHPYTQLLAAAAPDPRRRAVPAVPAVGERVRGNSGVPGDDGCRFRARCPFAMPACRARPVLFGVGDGRQARCWLYRDGAA